MMAPNKLLLPGLLCLSASMCFAMQPAGFIEVRPDGTRTLFTTERVSRNDQVVAQFADGAAQSAAAKCCVALRVTGRRKSQAKVSDELKGRQVRAFALSPLKAGEPVPFVGAALLFKAGERIPIAFDRASTQGAAEGTFPVTCTSSEGVHLLELDQGKPRVHLYMHLDYDVEPTCTTELLSKFY